MCHETLWSRRCIVDSSYGLCVVRPCGPGDVLLIPPIGCAMRPCGPGDVLLIPPVGYVS